MRPTLTIESVTRHTGTETEIVAAMDELARVNGAVLVFSLAGGSRGPSAN
jgi:hypothetical protein